MLEKTEGTIKNGQSRDTGNIWYIYKTQDKDKQNITLKIKKMSNMDSTKKPGVKPGAHKS